MPTTPKIRPYVLEAELLILGRKSFIELYMVKSIKNFRCALKKCTQIGKVNTVYLYKLINL